MYEESISLCKKCPCLELFWSLVSRIRTEYGEILCISPYLVQMQENTDQNNSEHGHSLRSVYHMLTLMFAWKNILLYYLSNKIVHIKNKQA